VGTKRELWERSERNLILEGESIILLEGSQALPAFPSDKDGLRIKALGW
jgi:hypothetical protein